MQSLLLALLLCPAATLFAQQAPWQAEQSGTVADLRGIHAAGAGVAWASGTGGTVLRTEDAGFEWQGCAVPPGAASLDFRGIWAWDANTAIVMSSGPGALSRLYRTDDGCAHWTLLRTNAEKDGFWDSMVFADRNHGYLLGDPVAGRLVLDETRDGGRSWKRVEAPGLDHAPHGAFAASNSSLALSVASPGERARVWIATGGPGGALVLRQADGCAAAKPPAAGRGRKCTEESASESAAPFEQQETPLEGDTASQGGFSLALLPGPRGVQSAIVVGGDYSRPGERSGTAATLHLNRNVGWQPASPMPGGFRSSVACDADGICLAVGPNGTDASVDAGRSWVPVEHAPAAMPKGGEWNALSLPWVVGPGGRVAKLDPGQLQALLPKPGPAGGSTALTPR